AYRGGVADLERLGREADERRNRLRAVEQESRADRAKLLSERRARKAVLDRVALEVRASRREMKVLRADEARMAQLVEEIGRVFAKVEREPEPVARVTFS